MESQQLDKPNRFAVRCYEWALLLWEQELTDDFQILREFEGLATHASIALDVMSALRRDDRKRVAQALVGRSHTEALAALGQSPSNEDRHLLEMWADASMKAPAFLELGRAEYRPDSRRLKKLLADGLASLKGTLRRDRDWRHTAEFDGWLVHTDLSFSGGSYQFDYGHTLLKDERVVARNLSLLSILGVGLAKFDRVGEGAEANAARSFERGAKRFMKGLAFLLS